MFHGPIGLINFSSHESDGGVCRLQLRLPPRLRTNEGTACYTCTTKLRTRWCARMCVLLNKRVIGPCLRLAIVVTLIRFLIGLRAANWRLSRLFSLTPLSTGPSIFLLAVFFTNYEIICLSGRCKLLTILVSY